MVMVFCAFVGDMVCQEVHVSPYAMHPGRNNMYRDCLTCQQGKVEHQLHSGLLQPIKIPQWNWDWLSYIFQRLSDFTGYQYQSVQIKIPILYLDSGKSFTRHWVLVWILVFPSIRKLTDNSNESFKY
ncbi:NBS-LRR resistance-like protein [Gossypium australe]|uniref:NBS-LRR resistance-like protein n=1 Tax=Gossypium australe TaxID=47621 RepID=A0A5B6VP58_9ROSI|nr:NBS-LRR resistance-like protein [Gossypium australe]